jgi:hypothetical protein
MKLARPDVFHPRIVLAGCRQLIGGDADDAGLVGALRDRGLHARWMSWDDPEVSRAHLVILRATHDYGSRLDEFLAWNRGVANLLNAPAVVAWNADRRYLSDLAEREVPTVPGHVFAPGDQIRLPRTGHIYVSPTVGSETRRCADRSAAATYAAELHEAGRGVFVQAATGTDENVLIFLGGEPSHACTAVAGEWIAAELDFEIWDAGAAALAAAAAHLGIDTPELLYARAHLVGEQLLDLQLIEPSLQWRQLDSHSRGLAQRKFALCVESALERLGLGPLSHRRP